MLTKDVVEEEIGHRPKIHCYREDGHQSHPTVMCLVVSGELVKAFLRDKHQKDGLKDHGKERPSKNARRQAVESSLNVLVLTDNHAVPQSQVPQQPAEASVSVQFNFRYTGGK